MEKIIINLPISKPYFTTFIISLVDIRYFNKDEFTIQSLKNLLFPPEHSDEEFNKLVKFVWLLFDMLIISGKDRDALENEVNLYVKLLLF